VFHFFAVARGRLRSSPRTRELKIPVLDTLHIHFPGAYLRGLPGATNAIVVDVLVLAEFRCCRDLVGEENLIKIPSQLKLIILM